MDKRNKFSKNDSIWEMEQSNYSKLHYSILETKTIFTKITVQIEIIVQIHAKQNLYPHLYR